MAALAPQPVKAVGKRRLQPLHARDQIAGGCLQRQVVVVAHHHKRVQYPARLPARLEQAGLKREPRFFTRKDVRAIVAAIDDVITGPRELQPQFAWHATTVPARVRPSILNIKT